MGLEIEQGGNLTHRDHSGGPSLKIPRYMVNKHLKWREKPGLNKEWNQFPFKPPADNHMCPLICFPNISFPSFGQSSTWICPEHRKKIFLRFHKMLCLYMRSICTMFKQSAEINSIVQTFWIVLYFSGNGDLFLLIPLCTIGSTSKWTGKKQTNVKSHLFCFMSFNSCLCNPSSLAVLLLWDLT